MYIRVQYRGAHMCCTMWPEAKPRAKGRLEQKVDPFLYRGPVPSVHWSAVTANHKAIGPSVSPLVHSVPHTVCVCMYARMLYPQTHSLTHSLHARTRYKCAFQCARRNYMFLCWMLVYVVVLWHRLFFDVFAYNRGLHVCNITRYAMSNCFVFSR